MIEAVIGRDVTGYTNFPSESEVLLGLGTQLRVKDDALQHLGGLIIVHLMEITDHHDIEPLPITRVTLDLKPKSSQKGALSK